MAFPPLIEPFLRRPEDDRIPPDVLIRAEVYRALSPKSPVCESPLQADEIPFHVRNGFNCNAVTMLVKELTTVLDYCLDRRVHELIHNFNRTCLTNGRAKSARRQAREIREKRKDYVKQVYRAALRSFPGHSLMICDQTGRAEGFRTWFDEYLDELLKDNLESSAELFRISEVPAQQFNYTLASNINAVGSQYDQAGAEKEIAITFDLDKIMVPSADWIEKIVEQWDFSGAFPHHPEFAKFFLNNAVARQQHIRDAVNTNHIATSLAEVTNFSIIDGVGVLILDQHEWMMNFCSCLSCLDHFQRAFDQMRASNYKVSSSKHPKDLGNESQKLLDFMTGNSEQQEGTTTG